jgi:hypothetical protein
MNPVDLVTDSLINTCKNKKSIVVIGFTKTGKITIAKKLSEYLDIPILISDYYYELSKDKALEYMMYDIKNLETSNIPYIVEGVLCFRLLRKGIQLNNFYPDLIIKTECNDKTIQHFYHKDNESSKIKKALSFNKGLDKIWLDYINLSQENNINIPPIITLNTSIF